MRRLLSDRVVVLGLTLLLSCFGLFPMEFLVEVAGVPLHDDAAMCSALSDATSCYGLVVSS